METLRATMNIQNLCYWIRELTMIDCPQYGYISDTNDFCENCSGCIRGKR